MTHPLRIAQHLGEVCQRRKALHGLKQDSSDWFDKWSIIITSLGFIANNHDSTLFVRCTSVGHILLSLYTDDMIICDDDYDGIESINRDLTHWFNERLKNIMLFLGIEVAQSLKGYILSQLKYISDMFEHAQLTDNRSIVTPLETNARYFTPKGVPLSYMILYHILWIIWCILVSPTLA